MDDTARETPAWLGETQAAQRSHDHTVRADTLRELHWRRPVSFIAGSGRKRVRRRRWFRPAVWSWLTRKDRFARPFASRTTAPPCFDCSGQSGAIGGKLGASKDGAGLVLLDDNTEAAIQMICSRALATPQDGSAHRTSRCGGCGKGVGYGEHARLRIFLRTLLLCAGAGH